MKTNIQFSLFLSLCCYLCFSQNYYVSFTNGNNTNPGTITQPFKTIQRAVNSATAGSTVFVREGTYVENIIAITNSGSSTNPIVFKNYTNETVYIEGGGITAGVGTSIWMLRDVSNITIDGFIFQNIINNQVKGIIINKNCQNITVQNCKFTNIHFSNDPNESPLNKGASPLIAYGSSETQSISNLTFSNNEVYNCRTGFSEGMTVVGNVDGFIINNNYLHNLTNIGIDAAGNNTTVCPNPLVNQARNGVIKNNILDNCMHPTVTTGALYVDGGKDIIVENNYSFNGSVGISVGSENPGTANNITIRNNVSYNNSVTGLWIGGASAQHAVTNCSVIGNTCYKNDTSNNWAGEMNVAFNNNLTVNNNIFFSDNSNNVVFNYLPNNGTGNVFNHNVFHTPNPFPSFTFNGIGYSSFEQYKLGTNNDFNSIFADPLFLNALNHDFHLAETSPAINAGNPTYNASPTEVDLDGQNRTNGIIDCGADETYYTLKIDDYANEQLIIYPNPTSSKLNIQLTNNNAITKIIITDNSGKTVAFLTNKFNSIDVENLPTGVYLIEVYSNENVCKTKFIKK